MYHVGFFCRPMLSLTHPSHHLVVSRPCGRCSCAQGYSSRDREEVRAGRVTRGQPWGQQRNCIIMNEDTRRPELNAPSSCFVLERATARVTLSRCNHSFVTAYVTLSPATLASPPQVVSQAAVEVGLQDKVDAFAGARSRGEG